MQRVDSRGLLRGGVGGKHRATQEAIVNVQQYSIDGYICASCVTTHDHRCIHRVQQYVFLSATVAGDLTVPKKIPISFLYEMIWYFYTRP